MIQLPRPTPVLLALGLPIAAAQDPAVPVPKPIEVPKKKIAAVSLLPSGSRMERVMLPRYDLARRLSGVLNAGCMTLLNDESISGSEVEIRFFNPDQSPRGEIRLKQATFHQSRGSLEASEDVQLHTDRLRACGSGLTYAFERGEGWLHGPVSTWIQTTKPTAMHPTSASFGAAVAATLATASPMTQAAPPAPPTAVERQALADDAASRAESHSSASGQARERLRADLDAANAATQAARSFLDENPAPAVPAGSAPHSQSQATPLEVPPNPEDTRVSSDRGMYFDSENGLFVYLGNVTVKDPRFELTGADELKIFLEKKPANSAAATPAPDSPVSTPADASPTPDSSAKATPKGPRFGDVDRIVASGAVRIIQKQPQPGKEPVEASGGLFTFHPKSGEIILTGRYPWVRQGTTYMRAKEPNLILRIQKSGSFVTEGNWDMGGRLNPDTKQP